MSHEITDTDGLALVGKPAWHGLGTVLPEGIVTPKDALRIAKLDWRVNVAPIFAQDTVRGGPIDGAPIMRAAPDHRAIVREDTGDVLGIVSDGFRPVQNEELAELLQALGRPVETMGSLRGGRVLFALLRQGEFQVGSGDRIRQYLLAVNGHDGSRALSFLPTDVRVVCANTLRSAEAGANGTVRLLHTSGLPERVKHAARALETAEALVTQQRTWTQELADTRWDETTRTLYLARTAEDIVGAPVGSIMLGVGPRGLRFLLPDGSGDPVRHEALQARVLDVVGSIRAMDRHAFQAVAPEGSAWRSFQSVSHWAHHVRKGRQDPVESRLSGAVSGLVSRAFRRALALSGW